MIAAGVDVLLGGGACPSAVPASAASFFRLVHVSSNRWDGRRRPEDLSSPLEAPTSGVSHAGHPGPGRGVAVPIKRHCRRRRVWGNLAACKRMGQVCGLACEGKLALPGGDSSGLAQFQLFQNHSPEKRRLALLHDFPAPQEQRLRKGKVSRPGIPGSYLGRLNGGRSTLSSWGRSRASPHRCRRTSRSRFVSQDSQKFPRGLTQPST